MSKEENTPSSSDMGVYGGYDLFNERTRRLIVQRYVYLHVDGKVEVDTNKTEWVDAKEELQSEERKAQEESGLLHGPNNFGVIYRSAEERNYWENRSIGLQERLGKVPPFSKTAITVPDGRFKDLVELEKKYTREIKVTEKQRAIVEERLYPLVMLLIREKRIKGKFELPEFQDLQLDGLNKRVRDLEARVDALDFGADAPKNPEVSQG